MSARDPSYASSEREALAWPALPQAFERQARSFGDAPALVFGETTWSYRELDRRAEQVARALCARGARPGDIIGVAQRPSLELVASLLGVQKIGAAYLPLDPGYPVERLAYMVSDAAPRCVLTTSQLAEQLASALGRSQVVCVERDLAAHAEPSSGADRPSGWRPVGPLDAAYVIYTSGSTGKPKGVVVGHGALANFLAFMAQRYRLRGGDVALSTTPISFDIAGLELYLPLVSGACLHLVPREVAVDGRALGDYVARARPSLMQGTPALWQLLREAGWRPDPALRVLCGGEAWPPDLADFLCSNGSSVWNVYGPTETTIWSTLSEVRAGEALTIGSPMWNTEAYVLDAALAPVQAGEDGELYLGGAGLARGYHGKSALTAERFVACPFGPPGARMYRTGDLVRRLADGRLMFLGRLDDQVKLRGFRIELGEIEAALLRQPGVARAKVIVREDEPGAKHLAGYVVAADGATLEPAALRRALAASLPEYMVPAGICVLPALPLTPSGKVDRKALPPLHFGGGPRRAPATPGEAALVGLFAEVLRLPEVGADDSFFDLGGNSLLATRLISRLRATLAVELPIRAVFETPTPAGLAHALAGAGAARSPLRQMPRGPTLPLSFAQQRLWFLHQLEGPSATYNLPIAIRLTGRLELDALRAGVELVVARHESLRTRYVEGPSGPLQEVVAIERAPVPLVLRETTKQALPEALVEAALYPFDLAREVPIHVELFRVDEHDHVLLLCIHHIASDGWSLAPLIRDLCDAYQARCRGQAPTLAPLPVQYADYTLWQREQLGSDTDPASQLSQQLGFWRRTLANLPEQLNLPFDRRRPAVATFRGDVVPFQLDAPLCAELSALATRAQVSLFMVLQAATAALLTKLGAGNDIPLGSPIAGRTDSALDELVGFFVNTLVLRTDTSGDPTFLDLLARVKEHNLAAYANQDLPFEYLVDVLSPSRSASHHPLFQVMLVLQNNLEPTITLDGLTATYETVPTRTSKFDLTIEITERREASGGLRCEIEYATDLFDRSTVERLARYLQRVLRAVVAAPERTLASLELLEATERAQIVEGWNATARELSDELYPELFERQARHTPGALAVACGEQSLSYAELEREANRVARWLIAAGVGPDDLVGLSLRRSTSMLSSLLGILKAGGAYLPLDPDYPSDRLTFMLEDSAPRCLISTRDIAERLPPGARDLPQLLLDDPEHQQRLAAQLDTAPTDADRVAPLRRRNLAYVIYTSGSTGKPKGVGVTHAGVPNLARAYIDCFRLDEHTRFLQFSSINFDPTFCEMCCTLL
ncbi:MAG TPA: amino acid adenylation domain-containing protein, partial [Kofleriaceae bacterium]|nr:amino acid adenylation domain-containing protein [Kofleriaceae bacterium]